MSLFAIEAGAGRWLALVSAAMMFSSATAHASPLFELFGSSAGTGGLNARASGASSASAYFNPALLPKAPQGFELSFFVINQAISMHLDGRDPAVDVPVATLRASRRGQYPLPTTWLEQGCTMAPSVCNTPIAARPRQSLGSGGGTNTYVAFGFVYHIIAERLAFGLHTMMPIGSLVQGQTTFSDEREQFFTNSLHPELYADRLTPLSLALALGAKLTPWLSLGITSTLNLSNRAVGDTYVGNSSNLQESLFLSTKLDAAVGVAPHFAVLLEPIDRLDVSVTVHTPQSMSVQTDTGIFLSNGNKQTASRSSVFDWLPWIIGLGAAVDVVRSGEHVMTATATGTYELWSSYLNRQGEHPLPGYAWSNILTAAAGLRYAYARKLNVFLDGAFHPSPVPLQNGRTNYVDNDRISGELGVSYSMPIQDGKLTLRLGAQAQVHKLLSRHQNKIDPRLPGNNSPSNVVDEWPDSDLDPNQSPPAPYPAAKGLQTNNPGWPGFGSDGVLLGGGVNVAILF